MKAQNIKPRLFGIVHSNRDFEQKESWGKNQFNSSFPASLSSYLYHKNIENVYLTLDKNQQVKHSTISTQKLYGISPDADNLFFSFESVYTPYQQLVTGSLPRIDLVTQNRDNGGHCLKGIEIKLTALPDNSTCHLTDDGFGTEIVIRPDTIVYLACSIAILYKDNYQQLKPFFGKNFDNLKDWTNAENVLPFIPEMINTIDNILLENITKQEPLIMQPVWKTEGKSPKLANNCLDVFIWSNFAFIELYTHDFRVQQRIEKITRQARTIVWLFKMLYDFSKSGQFNHNHITDELSFNTRNDKAFSSNGSVTFPLMQCKELTHPRITVKEIKQIILGGGHNLLSPERRFDAIIFNTPELFD
jgi:hypothetical protein